MTENENVLRVLKGFTKLSSNEKREFISELNKYEASTESTKFLTETLIQLKAKSHLGPTNDNGCVCCGKG